MILGKSPQSIIGIHQTIYLKVQGQPSAHFNLGVHLDGTTSRHQQYTCPGFIHFMIEFRNSIRTVTAQVSGETAGEFQVDALVTYKPNGLT